MALLSAWPGRLSAQKIGFRKTAREVLESRLRDCPEKNGQRWRKIKDLFRTAGCGDDRLSEQPVPGFREPNVICVLPGENETTIIVGAHFDNIGAGHGVIDNWSGAVLLPTLYESLKVLPRKHTFIFVAFAAEEAGLKGSGQYARKMTREDVARTRAMVNLDCLGLGATAVLKSGANKMLTDQMIKVAVAAKIPLRFVNYQASRWDADSFSSKIPHITLHSIRRITVDISNTSNDNLDQVRWDEYYQSYLLLAMFLAYIDTQLN
jgi:aminopeptidase-like protein